MRSTVGTTAISGSSTTSLNVETDMRSWYTSGAYRFANWIEVGVYYSRFTLGSRTVGLGPIGPQTSEHVYDKVAAVRFDVIAYAGLRF
jgi:hypothetical protein